MDRWNSFLKGMSRIVDPFSHDPRVDEILNRSDADAIRSDWEAVGGDMWKAIESHYTDVSQLAQWRKENHNAQP